MYYLVVHLSEINLPLCLFQGEIIDDTHFSIGSHKFEMNVDKKMVSRHC